MITIGNKAFIEKTRVNLYSPSYSNIFTAYKNPSGKKANIWFKWVEWFEKNKIDDDFIEIIVPKQFTFCIQGKIKGRKFIITQRGNFIQAHTLNDVTIK